jgi:trk system potassium uptake protein TrkA
MYIIVVGCGRLGSNLAKELVDNGHDVCVIDRDSNRLRVLGTGFNGQRLKGVEFDGDNLLEAGVAQADALLAVTADDNINITVSLIAEKIYHVPKIIARVNDPGREYIYNQLKIQTLSPVQMEVKIINNSLGLNGFDVLISDDEYEVIELYVGKELSYNIEKVEKQYNCIISKIKRSTSDMIPDKKERILKGDKMVCTIHKKDKEKLINTFTKQELLL